MRLSGKSGLVTGAEGPLGGAIVRALAGAGARLCLASPNPAAAEALARETGAQVVAEAEAFAGPEPLGFLIEATPLPVLPVALTETVGLEEALAAAVRPLQRIASATARMERGGAVLCVSAAAGPPPEGGWLGPLLAWRAAAVAGLARELAPRGIRVNGLAPVLDGAAKLPGFLQRGVSKTSLSTPLGRAAEPAEVAEAALWLLGAEMVTGLTLPLDGGRGL